MIAVVERGVRWGHALILSDINVMSLYHSPAPEGWVRQGLRAGAKFRSLQHKKAKYTKKREAEAPGHCPSSGLSFFFAFFAIFRGNSSAGSLCEVVPPVKNSRRYLWRAPVVQRHAAV